MTERSRRAGRAPRARAGGRTGSWRLASRWTARGRRGGHRGSRGHRQVAAARDRSCARLRSRLSRAQRPRHRTRAGLPVRSDPPAVRASDQRGRGRGPRSVVVGGRSAGGRPFDRRSDDRAARVVSRSCAGRPQLRLATRLVLARLEPLDGLAAASRGGRSPVVRRAFRARSRLHRAQTQRPAHCAHPRHATAGSRRHARARHAGRRSPGRAGAAGTVDPRRGRVARRRAAAERARSRLRAGLPRGHRGKPVPARRAARRGRGPGARPHRGRRAPRSARSSRAASPTRCCCAWRDSPRPPPRLPGRSACSATAPR